MSSKTKLVVTTALVLPFAALAGVMFAKPVYAVPVKCADGSTDDASVTAIENGVACSGRGGVAEHSEAKIGDCPAGYIELSIAPGDINNRDNGRESIPDNCIPEGSDTVETNPIFVYLEGIINFLAVGVGVVAVISIVVAGFQYVASRDNPQSVQAAIHRIWNTIIAIILFIFMYAISNFLVPGGLLR